MFIEVELDASENMETANAEWQRWFTARLPPASMRRLHFHTVESMYDKVMQERRAQFNQTRFEHRAVCASLDASRDHVRD
jgi:hypothetical protein